MTDALPEFLEDKMELTATDLDLALAFAANANGGTGRREILLIAMEAALGHHESDPWRPLRHPGRIYPHDAW